LNGKLAKAPYFDKFADFVKENNGLLPIHVHIDAQGFIWVNLDASEVPAMQWDEKFNGVDAQPRMAGFDFSQYRYDHSWAMDGDCNWKVLADNYNECLHCKTAHPDTAKVVNIEIYRVEVRMVPCYTTIRGRKPVPMMGNFSFSAHTTFPTLA
jgi:phenylpropionate dioxygenase-like ring-hydroxylating dioxygenase large terminal subunit